MPTVVELKQLAKLSGYKGYYKLNKLALIQLLEGNTKKNPNTKQTFTVLSDRAQISKELLSKILKSQTGCFGYQNIDTVENTLMYMLDQQNVFFINGMVGNKITTGVLVNREEKEFKVYNMCTDKTVRGKGYGADIIKFLITYCKNKFPNTKTLVLDALDDTKQFYEKLGFVKLKKNNNGSYNLIYKY